MSQQTTATAPAQPKPPQLRMMKLMDSVLDYPLPEGYAVRTIDDECESDVNAWIEICKNGLLTSGATRLSYDARITNFQNGIINPKKDVLMVYEIETGKMVATITGLVMASGDGDIHMVAALPECRGKKIGHGMLSAALKKLQKDGVPRVHLTTDDWRKPAIKNYLTAGFRPVLTPETKDRWMVVFQEMELEPVPFLTMDGEPV